MTTADSAVRQSGSAPFRARARLIRLLGEELISDEVMAVVELVKNGYDADARRVTVALENVTDPARGLIRIRDDGCGMDLHTLLHSWMEPATSHKRPRAGKKVRTPLGRIQLGEKGVGRFAADKLGSELELVTRRAEDREEIVVRVRWHHYDHDRYLDEVENAWFTREPLEFAGREHGTLLLIRSLRATWNEEMVTRLHNGLVRLVSPSSSSSDFIIEVNSPEFPFASGRVVNPLLETAPYRLAGTVDENGFLTVQGEAERVIDLRPLCHNHFLPTNGQTQIPRCGPFFVSLNVWDLEPVTGNGFGIDNALRRMIKAASGVSIYRDGFRIWPYGEKDDDWLELNQRRVNNPTLRVSNNQVIGFVEITHAGNPDLRDRTSREGLLDTPAFFDLKALVLAALSVLETARFAHRRPVAAPRSTSDNEEDDEMLQRFAAAYSLASKQGGGLSMKQALYDMERLYRHRLEEERARYDQVARLAGTGMAAELLTDAFSREISNVTTLLRTLHGHALTATPQMQSLIEKLSERLDRVNEQLDLMGPLYRPSTKEVESLNVHGVVYDVISILAGRLAEIATHVSLVGDRTLSVRMNRGHLMQVLMILIENARQALANSPEDDRRLYIQVRLENSRAGILVADSGPGVPSNIQKLIFEPYYSTRRAGRGLGLHVARDILAGYNSTLDLVMEQSPLPGACFHIRFDGRRVSGEADP